MKIWMVRRMLTDATLKEIGLHRRGRMSLKELIQWHNDQGISAMRRANAATTTECFEANEKAEKFHLEAILLLSSLVLVSGSY